MPSSQHERNPDESLENSQPRAENEQPLRSYRDALVAAREHLSASPQVERASADDASAYSPAESEISSGEEPRSCSGDEADSEIMEQVERSLHEQHRETAGNENEWIPEGAPGPSSILGLPQTTRGRASNPESEASSERYPSAQPPLPRFIRVHSPNGSAAEVNYSSEGDYVRQEILRGGVTGSLLTPSRATSASESEGVMMRPSSRLRYQQNSNTQAHNLSGQDGTRVTGSPSNLLQQMQHEDSSSSTRSDPHQVERSREEHREMWRLRRYAGAGDETARYLVRVYDQYVADQTQAARLAPSLPPYYVRRSLWFVERLRRQRGEFLIDIDDAGLVAPNSIFARRPPPEEALLSYFCGRLPQTTDELFWTIEMASLHRATIERARRERAWSAPPPPESEPNPSVHSQRRVSSAFPRVSQEWEPRQPTLGFSFQNRQLRDLPVETPPPALREAFLTSQRQSPKDSVSNTAPHSTAAQPPAMAQGQSNNLHEYRISAQPAGLPTDMAHLLRMCQDGTPDHVIVRHLRRYLESTLQSDNSTLQPTPIAPPGLQFGAAPYIEPRDFSLRSPAVQAAVSEWQNSIQRNQGTASREHGVAAPQARDSSRQPATQPPQQSQEEDFAGPRDSVSHGEVQEEKRDDAESVEEGEGVA